MSAAAARELRQVPARARTCMALTRARARALVPVRSPSRAPRHARRAHARVCAHTRCGASRSRPAGSPGTMEAHRAPPESAGAGRSRPVGLPGAHGGPKSPLEPAGFGLCRPAGLAGAHGCPKSPHRSRTGPAGVGLRGSPGPKELPRRWRETAGDGLSRPAGLAGARKAPWSGRTRESACAHAYTCVQAAPVFTPMTALARAHTHARTHAHSRRRASGALQRFARRKARRSSPSAHAHNSAGAVQAHMPTTPSQVPCRRSGSGCILSPTLMVANECEVGTGRHSRT